MPLQILQEDITNIECDAIVNSTNQLMIPGGGIDKLIHNLAGQELKKACEKIGRLQIGQAVITPAFKLPVKFIIHTVGPYWLGGDSNEKEMLISCYKECLALAKGTKCESVAFPLISSGCYDYPKQEVLKVAITTIKEFLQNNELMVYLVVYNKNSYSLNEELFNGMEKYIESNYENFENSKIEE